MPSSLYLSSSKYAFVELLTAKAEFGHDCDRRMIDGHDINRCVPIRLQVGRLERRPERGAATMAIAECTGGRRKRYLK